MIDHNIPLELKESAHWKLCSDRGRHSAPKVQPQQNHLDNDEKSAFSARQVTGRILTLVIDHVLLLERNKSVHWKLRCDRAQLVRRPVVPRKEWCFWVGINDVSKHKTEGYNPDLYKDYVWEPPCAEWYGWRLENRARMCAESAQTYRIRSELESHVSAETIRNRGSTCVLPPLGITMLKFWACRAPTCVGIHWCWTAHSERSILPPIWQENGLSDTLNGANHDAIPTSVCMGMFSNHYCSLDVNDEPKIHEFQPCVSAVDPIHGVSGCEY